MSAKKRRSSVAIDTVPLPDKVIGMKVRPGKVTRASGRYYFQQGRRKYEIPVGTTVTPREVAKLVGKEAYAAFASPRSTEIVAIGLVPKRPPINCYWIICYIPRPDILEILAKPIREVLITQMISKKIITPELGRIVRSGYR